MKALTVKQPYASLIIEGEKKYEMRSWKPSQLGRLAIHAGLSAFAAVDLMNLGLASKYWSHKTMPLGAIVGIVEVVSIIDTQTLTDEALRNWDNALHPITFKRKDYRYAWELKVIAEFPQPIAATGKMGLWDWDIDAALKKAVQA